MRIRTLSFLLVTAGAATVIGQPGAAMIVALYLDELGTPEPVEGVSAVA